MEIEPGAVNEGVIYTRKKQVGRGILDRIQVHTLDTLCDIPPNSKSVMIKVHKCGVSFEDVMLAHEESLLAFRDKSESLLFGTECVGTIVKTQDKLSKFMVGDKVLALPESGAWADYIVVEEDFVFWYPSTISSLTVIGLGVHYLLALRLVKMAKLEPYSVVLIFGALGGVGRALSQVCRELQPRVTVYGVTSKPNETELIFEAFFTYEDFTKKYSLKDIKKILKERPVDVVFDGVGGKHTPRACELLKRGGKYMCYGTAGGLEYDCLQKVVRYIGTNLNWTDDQNNMLYHNYLDKGIIFLGASVRYELHGMHQRKVELYHSLFYELLDMLVGRDRIIKPYVRKQHPLHKAALALTETESRENGGKCILHTFRRKFYKKESESTESSGVEDQMDVDQQVVVLPKGDTQSQATSASIGSSLLKTSTDSQQTPTGVSSVSQITSERKIHAEEESSTSSTD